MYIQCRLEFFVFALYQAIMGNQNRIPLFALCSDGSWKQYNKVQFTGDGDLPEQGKLSNPADKILIKSMQDKMISVHGHYAIAQVTYAIAPAWCSHGT